MSHVDRMDCSVNSQRLNRLHISVPNSPANNAYCYAELTVSSLVVAEIITIPHGRMARLSWPESLR